MKMEDAGRCIAVWKAKAKDIHGYTDKELAKRLGCSKSAIDHRKSFYRMPFHLAMSIKELADEDS